MPLCDHQYMSINVLSVFYVFCLSLMRCMQFVTYVSNVAQYRGATVSRGDMYGLETVMYCV